MENTYSSKSLIVSTAFLYSFPLMRSNVHNANNFSLLTCTKMYRIACVYMCVC